MADIDMPDSDPLPQAPSGLPPQPNPNPDDLTDPLSEMNLDSEKQAELEAAHNAEMAAAIEQDDEDEDEQAAAAAEEAARRELLEAVANEDNYEAEAYEQDEDISDDDVAREEAEVAPVEEDEEIDPYSDIEEGEGDGLADDENAEDRGVPAFRRQTRQQARLAVQAATAAAAALQQGVGLQQPGNRTTRGTQRVRGQRRTREQKYADIYGEMKRARLPPKQWMMMFNGYEKKLNKTYRNHIRQSIAALEHEHVFSARVIRNELKKLVGKPFFDQYKPEESMQEVNLQEMHSVIEEAAPTWVDLLRKLLPNKKVSIDKEIDLLQKQDRLRKRIAVMTQMAVRSISLKKASVFGKQFGLYLVTSGVPYHVISVINNMGLSSAARTIQVLMRKTENVQDQRVIVIARDKRSFTVYDNLVKQKNRKGVQKQGDRTEMLNMTTSYIGINKRIPEGGLTKDMLDLNLKLGHEDILKNLADDAKDGTRIYLSLYHIDQALGIVFGPELKGVFENYDFEARHQAATTAPQASTGTGTGTGIGTGSRTPPGTKFMRPGTKTERFAWPMIDMMDPKEANDLVPMKLSMNDEVSIAGSKEVLKDIFLDNMQLDEDKDFGDLDAARDKKSRLYPIVGDQMTCARFNSCQSEGVESERPYDRYDWGVIVPGWLHICMNKAYGIVKTHFDKNSEGAQLAHCLLTDALFNTMKGIGKDNPKYFLILNLLYRMFRSRITACFQYELGLAGIVDYSDKSKSRIEVVKTAVSNLQPEQYLEIVENIQKKVFTKEAWQNKYSENLRVYPDADYTTMCRLLIQIEELMTMRTAIRKMDVGHLQRMVDHLIVPFLGTNQTNYAKHILELRWLLKQAQPLGRALMAISVVNPSGKQGKGIAADEEIELINNDLTLDLNHFGNSTHDMAAVARKKAGNRRAARALKKMFTSAIGVEGTNYHTNKNAVTDVLSMADKLFRDGLAERQPVGNSDDASNAEDNRALSDDIQQIGIEKLVPAIKALNESHNARWRGVTLSTSEAGNDGVDEIDGADARSHGPDGHGGDHGPLGAGAVDEADEPYMDADGFAWLGDGPAPEGYTQALGGDDSSDGDGNLGFYTIAGGMPLSGGLADPDLLWSDDANRNLVHDAAGTSAGMDEDDDDDPTMISGALQQTATAAGHFEYDEFQDPGLDEDAALAAAMAVDD